LRLKAAQTLGMTEVPVILCDEWSEAQVKAFRLMANRSVEWAEWDQELLALEMADLKDFAYDLTLTGFEPDEIASLLSVCSATAGLKDNVAPPDLKERGTTHPGALGFRENHRLLGGEIPRLADAQRLMDGQLADLVFTDPPYNVAYSGRGEINQLGTM